ncbi:hypothetical protein B296_00022116 [Ensete ventricosum]|uniref:Manganese/iron superoxide dismutase C-terminal domain-containing protein n=1 Tax=Ensete ventricosum TaxID=4639 RepID=A0A426YNX2_ENSVE|nr:hypothetical protein B296_00022116 [Ensete ventricosum]
MCYCKVWNHDFFWQSVKPGGGGRPSGRLMELIERDFGSFDRMLEEFQRAALTQFGSGWVWLVYKANRLDVGNAVNPCPSEKDNKLVVLKSPNAVNPIIWDYSPLLAIDVWEVKVLNSSLNYFTFTFLDYFCNLTLMQIFFWLHSTLTILITRSVPHLYLQNRRADYVSIFLEKLVSWEVVNNRLDVAMERAAERAREDETRRQEDDAEMTCSEAEEMYLDTDTDDSEAE